jgi:hypothetical protein
VTQNLENLRKANHNRIGRSVAKKEIAAGKLSVLDALSLPCCQTATLACLLKAQWRWGDFKTANFLSRRGISQSRRVMDLTANQIEALRASLESHHPQRTVES